ncbi:MAG: 4Fe-4S binding protein [Candidatus Thermoplasmatota archaeon]
MLSLDDLLQIPTEEQLKKGVVVIECVQRIPCNPCVTVCPVQAISMSDINDTPSIDYDKCTGCGRCVGICPGLSIFTVKVKGDKALVTLPYEFLPVPKTGDIVKVVDRSGNVKGEGLVKKVNRVEETYVITVEVEASLGMMIRHIKVKKNG